MVPALLAITLLFGVLFFTRLGGAYRSAIIRLWPVVLLAGAAFVCLLRGLIGPAIVLGSLAAVAWLMWPSIERAGRPRPISAEQDSPEDSAARRALGVGPNATLDEIRRAYRAKMVQAHPDRGGSHSEAARLAAARDRLLKKKR